MSQFKTRLRSLLQTVRYDIGLRRKTVHEVALSNLRIKERIFNRKVSFRLGGRHDILSLSEQQHDYDLGAKAYGLERLTQGDKAILGYIEDEIVLYAWMMYGQMELHQGAFIRIPDDCVYVYKLFVVKSQRGKGILHEFYRFIRNQLEGDGVVRLRGWAVSDNRLSLRAHRKLGFFPIGTIHTVEVVNWRWSRYRIAAPDGR